MIEDKSGQAGPVRCIELAAYKSNGKTQGGAIALCHMGVVGRPEDKCTDEDLGYKHARAESFNVMFP